MSSRTITREHTFISLEPQGNLYIITAERQGMTCCRVKSQAPTTHKFIGNTDNWKSYPNDGQVHHSMVRWLNEVLKKNK